MKFVRSVEEYGVWEEKGRNFVWTSYRIKKFRTTPCSQFNYKFGSTFPVTKTRRVLNTFKIQYF